MQYSPTAPELLIGVGDALDEVVLPAVDGGVGYTVRIASNLVRLVARELTLGPGALDGEVQGLRRLLDRGGDLDELHDELAARLRSGAGGDFEADAWSLLVEIVRSDVAIAKPGYSDWVGG